MTTADKPEKETAAEETVATADAEPKKPAKAAAKPAAAKSGGKNPNLKITLKKSLIGSTERQRRVATSLGLRKTNQVVHHVDTPIIQGMIHKLQHLIKVEMI